MIIGRPKSEIEERTKAIRSNFLSRYDADSLREELCEEQIDICILCGKLMQARDSIVVAIDHMICVYYYAQMADMPIEEAIEYANARQNLKAVHMVCNGAKGSIDDEQWFEEGYADRIGEPRTLEYLMNIEERRKAVLLRNQSDPEWHAAQSERMKTTHANHPELAIKHSEYMKAKSKDPKVKAAFLARLTVLHADPAFAARRDARTKAMHADPAFAIALSKRGKALHTNPETVAKQKRAWKIKNEDPEFKAEKSARWKALNADPEFKAARLAAWRAARARPESIVMNSERRKIMNADPQFKAASSARMRARHERKFIASVAWG